MTLEWHCWHFVSGCCCSFARKRRRPQTRWSQYETSTIVQYFRQFIENEQGLPSKQEILRFKTRIQKWRLMSGQWSLQSHERKNMDSWREKNWSWTTWIFPNLLSVLPSSFSRSWLWSGSLIMSWLQTYYFTLITLIISYWADHASLADCFSYGTNVHWCVLTERFISRLFRIYFVVSYHLFCSEWQHLLMALFITRMFMSVIALLSIFHIEQIMLH